MSNCTTQYLPSYTVGVDAYRAVPQVVGAARVDVIGGRERPSYRRSRGKRCQRHRNVLVRRQGGIFLRGGALFES